MQGLTSVTYRNLAQDFFGPFDATMTPFISPTLDALLTPRRLNDLLPDRYREHLIPQLLVKKAEPFLAAVKELSRLGFHEVNLNLGCPAATVVAKGKGSALLRDVDQLRTLLEGIFSVPRSVTVSVKTRLGFTSAEDFSDLVRLFNRFPITSLIVHPRIRTDFYKGSLRLEALDEALKILTLPLVINGDIATVKDIREVSRRYPTSHTLMIGRGLVANPALIREWRTGEKLTLPEIVEFARALTDALSDAFASRKNAIRHMKEYWYYFQNVFADNPKGFRAILRATDAPSFEAATEAFIRETPFLGTSRGAWRGR